MKKAFLILCTMVLLITPVRAKAAQKEVPFELDKNYDACAFTVTTEDYGYFDVTVVSPKGEEYQGYIEGTNSTEVLVRDVKKGEWSVVVAEHVFDTESSTEESSLGNEVAEEGESSIGKVKVSVRAIDTSSYAIETGDIKVAKDITGLKMYFKDDNLEVEWSDSSTGNVVVTVTDTQTQVELGKETVKGNDYECEIPSSTKQITVTIVPSTSSNIEGASSQYTLDVDNHPDAMVTYENKEYVNTDTIPVDITLNDRYAVEFFVNEKSIDSVDYKEAGTYEYEIPINEGMNEIPTYIVDEDGNMRSTAYEVTRDSVQPKMSLDYAYDGKTVYVYNVTFSGTVSDYDSFTINGDEVDVSGDGVFTYAYELHEGENTVVFIASDKAGNETTYNAVITKATKEEKEIPWIPIASGTAFVIIIVVYLIRRKDDPRNGKYNNMIDGIKDKVEKRKASREKISDKTSKNEKKKVTTLTSMQKAGLGLLVVVLLANLFFKFVLIPGYVPSASMYPTLKIGDWGFANGLAYVMNEPQRGDIIVFRSSENDEILIKRVIGLPGDTVSFYDGYVYINDGLIYEEYIDEKIETNSLTKDFTVPDGCYFVLGDNRTESYDSRFWDDPYVKKSDIIGKYMITIFNFK